MKTYILDGEAMTTREAAHDELAAKLGLPADYGRNLDALADCLRGLPAGDIVIEHAPAFAQLGDYADKILEVFTVAALDRGDLTFQLLDGEAPVSLDITRPLADLTADHPDLRDLLAEMGIEDVPAGKTLTAIAHEMDVDPAIFVFTLEASDYDVQGFVPDEPQQGDNIIPDILGRLFADSEYDPSAIDRLIHEAQAAGENESMYARMEEAVRRAEREGRL
jgi:ribonuclease inhibitor